MSEIYYQISDNMRLCRVAEVRSQFLVNGHQRRDHHAGFPASPNPDGTIPCRNPCVACSIMPTKMTRPLKLGGSLALDNDLAVDL